MLTSDSTLRFRERDEVTAALLEHGYAVDDVLGAPDRPGREFVFVARRPAPGQTAERSRKRSLPRAENGSTQGVGPARVAGVNLRIQCLCIDTVDPMRLAGFWQSALGWRRTYESDAEVVLEPPPGSPEDGVVPDLLFLRVPEEKAGKNRLHLDLRPRDQAVEVARLEGLGASRSDVGQGPDVSWVVLADPDGNEFCVLWPLTAEEHTEAR